MVGGAEEMVLNLVRHLPPDKYEPMVCAIHEPGPIGREIEATGVPFRTLGRVPGLRDPMAVATLYRICGRFSRTSSTPFCSPRVSTGGLRRSPRVCRSSSAPRSTSTRTNDGIIARRSAC